MTTDLVFCGRDAELAMLAECWQRAADVDNPQPQLVVLPAEPGVGKTRLALEFLARQVAAQPGDNAYWPADARLADGRLRLNIPAEECRFDRPIPFLWWGIAAQAEGGDSVALHDRFLAPHLVAMSMRARMAGTGLSLAKIWGAAGADALASALQVDSVLSIGGAFLESVKLLHGEMGRGATQALAGDTLVKNRVDALLADLEQVLNPAARLGYARVPAIILIDDAQFAAADAGLLRFIERLTHAAMTQRWPVMILMTHWHTEWTLDAERGGRSVATLVHHARYGGSDEPGPISGTPGGYLNSENYREIRLAKLDDLDPALGAALPGLPVEQRRALLDAVDGNPRFLEQVIAYLRGEPRLFDDFDPARALTEEGLAEALSRSQRVHEVVLARLTSPQVAPEVREALALASVQGMRVVREVVEAAGQALLGHDLSEPLLRGQNPFSVMAFEADSKVGQFTERLFLQAAGQLRRNIKGLHDEEAVKAALMPGLRQAIASETLESARAGSIASAVALHLYGDLSDPEQRSIVVLAAAVRLLALEEPTEICEVLDRLREAIEAAGDAGAMRQLLLAVPHRAMTFAARQALMMDRMSDCSLFTDLMVLDDIEETSIDGDMAGRAASWLMTRGHLRERVGEWESAHSDMSRAMPLFLQAIDQTGSLEAVNGVGLLLRRRVQGAAQQGNFDRVTADIDGLLSFYKTLVDRGILAADQGRRGAGATYDLYGHVLRQSGRGIEADAAFAVTEDITRTLAASGSLEDRRNLAALLNTKADGLLIKKNIDAARASSHESIQIMRGLIATAPRVEWVRDLAYSLTMRARVEQAAGSDGLAEMQEALNLLQQVQARWDTDTSRADVASGLRNVVQAATLFAIRENDAGEAALGGHSGALAFGLFRRATGALIPYIDEEISNKAVEILYTSALQALMLAPHVNPPPGDGEMRPLLSDGFVVAVALLRRGYPTASASVAEAGEECAKFYGDDAAKARFAEVRAVARDRENMDSN
ncbi:ATP-binding protein [Sphingopyxis solisilvae]|uniref:ATP-binding protein n=1 Tax=Sphingopyxis solisilvae TaxID=1886788 RepID=UPI001892CC1F|nr:ATP-binding protein [Sphingopyxis solisilvae]